MRNHPSGTADKTVATVAMPFAKTGIPRRRMPLATQENMAGSANIGSPVRNKLGHGYPSPKTPAQRGRPNPAQKPPPLTPVTPDKHINFNTKTMLSNLQVIQQMADEITTPGKDEEEGVGYEEEDSFASSPGEDANGERDTQPFQADAAEAVATTGEEAEEVVDFEEGTASSPPTKLPVADPVPALKPAAEPQYKEQPVHSEPQKSLPEPELELEHEIKRSTPETAPSSPPATAALDSLDIGDDDADLVAQAERADRRTRSMQSGTELSPAEEADEKDKQLARLKDEVFEKDIRIKRLEDELASVRRVLQTQRSRPSSREESRFEDRIAQLQGEVRKLKAANQELKSKPSNEQHMESRIAKLEYLVVGLRTQLDRSQARSQRLQVVLFVQALFIMLYIWMDIAGDAQADVSHFYS